MDSARAARFPAATFSQFASDVILQDFLQRQTTVIWETVILKYIKLEGEFVNISVSILRHSVFLSSPLSGASAPRSIRDGGPEPKPSKASTVPFPAFTRAQARLTPSRHAAQSAEIDCRCSRGYTCRVEIQIRLPKHPIPAISYPTTGVMIVGEGY